MILARTRLFLIIRGPVHTNSQDQANLKQSTVLNAKKKLDLNSVVRVKSLLDEIDDLLF